MLIEPDAGARPAISDHAAGAYLAFGAEDVPWVDLTILDEQEAVCSTPRLFPARTTSLAPRIVQAY